MDRDPRKRYAESLEETIRSDHHYLKKAIKDFKELCLLVTPEKNAPPEIILEIRETYKEIRTRLTEIKAVEQVLQGKYRQFYRRDAMRDKEILEFGFIAKNCYSKFEYILMQKEAQKKAKEWEAGLRVDPKGVFYHWFHSKEHQVMFIRSLRALSQLDGEMPFRLEARERRQITPGGLRGITLFVFSGESQVIDQLQSRIQLRKHDLMERYAQEELHGLLTHRREIDPMEMENKFRAFLESGEFARLKCLLFSVSSPKRLGGDMVGLIKETLEGMREGEVKSLSS